jgi:hypothetical protein
VKAAVLPVPVWATPDDILALDDHGDRLAAWMGVGSV